MPALRVWGWGVGGVAERGPVQKAWVESLAALARFLPWFHGKSMPRVFVSCSDAEADPRIKGSGFRGLGFRGVEFRGLGFRGLGFRGLVFRGLGFRLLGASDIDVDLRTIRECRRFCIQQRRQKQQSAHCWCPLEANADGTLLRLTVFCPPLV